MKTKRKQGGKPAGGAPAAQPAGAADVPAGSSRQIAVSVVEDDDWVRDNLAAMLNSSPDFRCLSRFGSAEEALAALPKELPDVVLMDIGLPQMSGIECVRRLKAVAPCIQVLMLTVYGDGERVFAALQAGGSGYLLKRVGREELFDAIRRVHRGESPMDGQIARKVVQYFNSRGTTAQELEQLSPRESEVLERLAKGEAYKEIAGLMGISIDTLRGHIKSVYQKLHVHSRGEAVAKYNAP